jgi:hypothetical protein
MSLTFQSEPALSEMGLGRVKTSVMSGSRQSLCHRANTSPRAAHANGCSMPNQPKCITMYPKPSRFMTEWIVVLAISLASCLLSLGPAWAQALALPFTACSAALLIALLAHDTGANRSVNRPPIEWSSLHDARPAPGTAVGTYAGNEFPRLVIDGYGRLFEYVGVAPRLIDGQFDVDALKRGEFIVRPGLVYRYRKERQGRWAAVTIRASKAGNKTATNCSNRPGSSDTNAV